ncbi:hypothetical protein DFH94DRAFT_689875 [Russula ochroleuca]|uniref:DUF4219 domain-containing protein n=1 Tax=Russula ochroleuca TaxID=152965 RepID=A0A9P5N0D1_9AGAM|nr:hypothetical protein DFH94DRAFT_689875 [Russula ochroleuca]
MSSSKEPSISSISSLTSENYCSWADDMKSWLQLNGLWRLVSGLEKKPASQPGLRQTCWELVPVKWVQVHATRLSTTSGAAGIFRKLLASALYFLSASKMLMQFLVNVPTGNGAKVGSNGLGMEEQQVEAQHSLYLDSFELDD